MMRLPLYVAEYVWRYNHRRLSIDQQTTQLMHLLAQHVPHPGDQSATLPLGIGSLELGACLVFVIWVLVFAAPAVLAEDMTVETYIR